MLHDARATLHQQVVAFAGCGTVEVKVARAELLEVILAHSAVIPHPLQPPRASERADDVLHVLPVGISLLTVDADYRASLPLAITRQRAVLLE